MIWKGRLLRDYGDLVNSVAGCVSREEAQQFMREYEAENPHARENVGFAVGELDQRDGERVMDWFDVEHPVFGKRYPTPQEAFIAGTKYLELWEKSKKHDGPWFLGALENK